MFYSLSSSELVFFRFLSLITRTPWHLAIALSLMLCESPCMYLSHANPGCAPCPARAMPVPIFTSSATMLFK